MDAGCSDLCIAGAVSGATCACDSYSAETLQSDQTSCRGQCRVRLGVGESSGRLLRVQDALPACETH